MYLQNKYTRWYYNIIQNAQLRKLESTTYVEKHHIIPKSIGGDNSKKNLVNLTPREHFICHLLLVKMTTGNNMYKMIYALNMISNIKNIGDGRYTPTSKIYEYVRLRHKEAITNSWTIEKRKLHAEKISKISKGRKHSEQAKEKMRNKIWTEKAKINLKEIGLKSASLRKGKMWSEKMRESRLNSYIDKNLEIAKKIIPLANLGYSNLRISKELNVTWDKVKYILKYQDVFNLKLNTNKYCYD